jgi:hypothetical protein
MMNKTAFALMVVLCFVVAAASGIAPPADPPYCEGHNGVSDAVFFQNMNFAGRDVSVYKTDSTKNICEYDNFCESKGLSWYAPLSGPEADEALTEMRAIDNYHTWILGKAPTLLGGQGVGGESIATWNGQALTALEGPNCVQGSSIGFSAIRNWACSMCDPKVYGVSKCWDNDHQYDWIICTGSSGVIDGGSDVPEFGVIAAGVVLIGAIAGIVLTRKNA